MELAILKYSLIVIGLVVTGVAIFIFARLTNFLVWLKGNVPALVIFLGIWLVITGWSLLPYVSASHHGIMTASVVKLSEGEYQLLVDDGQSQYKLIGQGDHFQSRTTLLAPGTILSMFGFSKMVVLDELVLQVSDFEQAVLANNKEVWQRNYGMTGAFSAPGMYEQAFLSRQVPLVEGAIYSLILRGDRLEWVATNSVAEQALGL